MRSRALYLLSIFLMFTLVACSKKPADTPSNSASQDMAAPSNAAGGNAMSSSPGASTTAAPAPAAALGRARGYNSDGEVGRIGRIEDQLAGSVFQRHSSFSSHRGREYSDSSGRSGAWYG